jgi:DNA gyrase subunit B
MSDTAPDNYRAEDVTVYRDLEHVRRRPAMYIGDTDARGLHRLVLELVANALDEHKAGFATTIEVRLLADGGCRVSDDGRGIPVELDPGGGESTLEILLTRVGTGYPPRPYRTCVGLHGLGSKVVNALSQRLLAEVRRGGRLWRQEYSRGRPIGPIEDAGPCETTGTTITFWPDSAIFGPAPSFEAERLGRFLRSAAGLNRGLTIRFTDDRPLSQRAETYHSPEGLADLLRDMTSGLTPTHLSVITLREQGETWALEAALRWCQSNEVQVRSYVNDNHTSQGGPHEVGLAEGAVRAVREEILRRGLVADRHLVPSAGDRRRGLAAIVAVQLQDPRFSGATKDRLESPEVEGVVRQAVRRRLAAFFRERPDEAAAICRQALEARDARLTDAKTGMVKYPRS